jgi:hypothetical protein
MLNHSISVLRSNKLYKLEKSLAFTEEEKALTPTSFVLSLSWSRNPGVVCSRISELCFTEKKTTTHTWSTVHPLWVNCTHAYKYRSAGRVVRQSVGMPKVAGLNPSGGSEFTFCSDLQLTARSSSTWAPIVVACQLCYPGNTHCFQRLQPPSRAG